jgi:hypothetical protein
MKGRLKFVDVFGQSTVITLSGLDEADANILPKLSSLSTTLRTYCNAAITEYGVSLPTITRLTGENAALDPYESTLHKGILRFSYVEDNEQKSSALYIPAPNGDGFDLIDGVGYRANADWGQAVCDALIAASGIDDLEFVNGVLEYIDGKSSKPTSGAYIKFQDINKRVQYMGVPGVTDISKLAAFSAALFEGTSDYSNAAMRELGFTEPRSATRNDTADTETLYDSVEGRAILNFGYIKGLYDKKTMTFTLPAAKKAIFADPPDAKNAKVDKTVGDAIATALTTTYGAGVRFLKFESGERDVVKLKL